MRRAILLVLLSTAWACSNPVSEGVGSTGAANGATGSGSGSTGGASTGSTAASTSGSSGSSSSGSGGSTTGASYAGYVLFNDISIAGLGNLAGGGLGNQHVVTAAFADADSGNALDPSTCVDGTLDTNGCCYREGAALGGRRDGGLPPPPGDGGDLDGGGAPPPALDAGAPTSGNDAGVAPSAGTLSLTADAVSIGQMQPANGVYVPFTTSTWNAGQLMGIAASGADLHAFSGSVTAPTSATITSPTLTALPPTTISTSGALLVTWTGEGQKALVLLTNQDLSKTLTCYGDNAGQRTISSASLATYFGPLSGQYGLLLVGVGNVSTATADNGSVTVAADTLTGGPVHYQ